MNITKTLYRLMKEDEFIHFHKLGIYKGNSNDQKFIHLSTLSQCSGTFKKHYEREWVFGLYNTYSRQNAYFVYFEIDALTSKPTAKQVSLLPIIPSVSFNFKF